MHVLMVTDAYPPMRTSCAVQMHSLGQALIEEGHLVTVITPESKLSEGICINREDGVRLLKVKAFKTKDVGYIRRTLSEFINPFLIWHELKKNHEFIESEYDGIIWYSPSIFWGPLIKRLKKKFNVKAYLILRDIFPDWALHLGLLSKKQFTYKFFKLIEQYQYTQANMIGIQSPNNIDYFKKNNPTISSFLEVLWNWESNFKCDRVRSQSPAITLESTILSNKTVFIYAGNLGVAQGLNSFIELVKLFLNDTTVGFLIVGRGSQMSALRQQAHLEGWNNILFHEEVDPEEIDLIVSQCHIGLVFLDERHLTHNIPGKLITYLSAGIPILANLNVGNDLLEIIPREALGQVWAKNSRVTFKETALKVLQDARCSGNAEGIKSFVKSQFSVVKAAKQIVEYFQRIS